MRRCAVVSVKICSVFLKRLFPGLDYIQVVTPQSASVYICSHYSIHIMGSCNAFMLIGLFLLWVVSASEEHEKIRRRRIVFNRYEWETPSSRDTPRKWQLHDLHASDLANSLSFSFSLSYKATHKVMMARPDLAYREPPVEPKSGRWRKRNSN